MRFPIVGAALFLLAVRLPAKSIVAKKSLSIAPSRQLIHNGDLEAAGPDGFAGWRGWALGCEADEKVKHCGRFSARCRNASEEEHRGLTYVVELNQRSPTTIVAECWSKAEDVAGGYDPNYSLYLDIEYMDGTPLWGQIAAFKPGTHDWQKRTVTVVPAKPIKTVHVHGIFRARTGTAWFDDASLYAEGSSPPAGGFLKDGGFEPSPWAVWPSLDGTYIDSFEMGSKLLNYCRAHLSATDTPLIFDSDGRLCQIEVFHTIEFAREVARRMWSQGKMTFANATPVDFLWPAAWLDVMGIETDWGPGGKYVPNPDSIMNYRRALCYQRPYLLLLNTRYEDFKPEWVELYMKRCAAYAIFPSMFSHNAADDPYWQRPNLYNRDRPLFRKYIPVISALNAAGWEPITHARSDNAKVYIERFGKPGGPLYPTLFNDSHQAQHAKIAIDIARLKPGVKRLAVSEALPTAQKESGRRQAPALPAARAVPGTAVLDIAIEPEDVKVLALR